MSVEFGMLGPLQVLVDEQAVPVPRGHQRKLLAALVAAWGRPVLIDDVIDLLWPDDPPRTARRTVEAEVSRLRGWLREVHPDLGIEREGATVALETGPATLDRSRFDVELRDARRGIAASATLRHARQTSPAT